MLLVMVEEFGDGRARPAIGGPDEAMSTGFDMASASLAHRDTDTENGSAILAAVIIAVTIQRDTSSAAFDIVGNVHTVESSLAGIVGAVLVPTGARVGIRAFATEASYRTIDRRTGGASLSASGGPWVGGRLRGGSAVVGLG